MRKSLISLFIIIGSSFCLSAQENDQNKKQNDDSSKTENSSEEESKWQDVLKKSLPFYKNKEGVEDDSNSSEKVARKTIEPDFHGLIINQDERIETLCQQYMENKEINGFKIQIFSSHSRWKSSKAKTDFIAAHPDLPVPKLIYQSPNFKLRLGNYRNRFEAEKVIKSLEGEFSSAFIVKDNIEVSIKN